MSDTYDDDDTVRDYFPEGEDSISLEEYEQEFCVICNSLINADGSAVNCTGTGECERGVAYPIPDFDKPLDFS